jgi:hypothetical protein
MSAMDRVIDAITGSIRMADKVEALSREVSALAAEVKAGAGEIRAIDRRLVRIEALVEFTAASRARPSAAPGPKALPAAGRKGPGKG